MGQQPVRGQRPRQPASQRRLVGQHPQQRRPRRASSRLNPARGAPVDDMGGFGNAQRNAVTAAAIAITLTRRIAEPGRTEQPFRRGKMAATGPGRADHIGGSRVTFRDRFQRSAPVPSPSRGPPAGRRHPGVLSGGAGNVCGDYVSGVPVQRRPGTVIPHRGSGVGVRGGLLHVPRRILAAAGAATHRFAVGRTRHIVRAASSRWPTAVCGGGPTRPGDPRPGRPGEHESDGSRLPEDNNRRPCGLPR